MNTNLGTELKRDKCPEKYCSKSSLLGDILPIIIASVVVAFFSGNLLEAGGVNFIVNLALEIIFILAFSSVFYFLFKGVKKRLSETYISVCENGICGIRAINGYKNGEFETTYTEITKVINKGERVFIDTKQGRLVFTLEDAAGTVELIRQKTGV